MASRKLYTVRWTQYMNQPATPEFIDATLGHLPLSELRRIHDELVEMVLDRGVFTEANQVISDIKGKL